MNGKSKRGLSQIISTVILIVLTLAIVAGVWTAVSNYVHSSLNHASSCNNIAGKVSLDPDYTCYDSISNVTLVSISRGLFSLDSLQVVVSNATSSKSFSLYNSTKQISYVTNYPDNTSGVTMPANESGQTFCIYGFKNSTEVDVAPKVNGNQCDATDSISDIPICSQSVLANSKC